MGAGGTPLGGPGGVVTTIMPAPFAGPCRVIITSLTYWSLIMKDVVAAVIIGLALTALALAYFDVLFI